ncbi:MAG TPA: preprotein translocase subunit SecG [Spongiibacteraceae bacterium]|nr:preprotein translocase subunit SecG [Spongiibacteraceae bacterium]
MEQIILIVHVLIALAITGLILIQQGKGADVGASFGGGASQTLFGAAGSGNVLTKMTSILAALFFITSLALAMVAKNKAQGLDDFSLPAVTETASQPVSAPVDSDLPAVHDGRQSPGSDLPEIPE